jgi:RNA polymerase sigma factor (sigma-70 family)
MQVVRRPRPRTPVPGKLRLSRCSGKGTNRPVDAAKLVQRASEGDQAAWNAIVEQFNGLLWSVVRAHRLSASDGAEVIQTAWLRLVENLDRIREPERVGAWLATTTRHECLKFIRRNAREVATSEVEAAEPPTDASLDGLLSTERDIALWKAFASLGERCQTLLRVLMAEAPPSYAEVSAALGMPIGAIGPTRQRCLERLRDHPFLAAFRLDHSGAP